MMITKLTENMLGIVNQNHSMKHYLESLERKIDFTPRSWLYDGEFGNVFLSPEAVLKKWVSILQEALTNNERLTALGLTPEQAALIIQFDTAQIAKWGPQGGHAPMSELLEEVVLPSFKASVQKMPSAFSRRLWRMAKTKVIRDLIKKVGKQVLEPASYKHVVDDMRARDTLESNSGFPDFRRRNLDEVKARAIEDAESGAWKDYPAIALFRTYNGKTRLVWMFPMAANLVEGSYFQPLMSALMEITPGDEALWTLEEGKFSEAKNDVVHGADRVDLFVCPWRGFTDVRLAVTSAMAKGFSIAASDFTSTDAHFQKWATKEVFDVIRQCFKKQYWTGLFESLMHMHEIPLVIGPDAMITGDHGVSSGSNWTNFVETIFDMIAAEYESLKVTDNGFYQDYDLEFFGLYAIGDDQTYCFESKFKEKTVAKLIKGLLARTGDEIGQEIKAEKTTVALDSVKTLQRLFLRDYIREQDGLLRGVYPTIRALKSSIYPERFHAPSKFDKNMFCLRQFMILENCVDHPLFPEFVEFICKGNRHLIPFAKKTRGQLEAIQRESKHVPGLNSTYNQEKRDSSIADFESIRIAREL